MDTSKFFNRKSSIRNPKVPYKKGKSIEESSNYKSRIFSRVKETKTVKTLLNIRTSVFRIENLLKANSNLENKSSKVQQKYKLIEIQEEKKKSKKSKSSGLGNIIQRPKTGAMDWIKNFVTYTFLGWLFTTLQPLISKLEVLGPILQGAFDFLGGTVKFLLDGFASFVKFGYDTKDFITKKSDEIKQQAQGLKENFDNTLAELKNVVDGTVDAVASYLEIVDKDVLAQAQQQSGRDSGSGIPPLPPVPSTDTSTYKPTIPTPQFGPVKGVSTGGVIGYAEGGRIDPRSPVTRGVPQEDEQKKKLLFPPQTTQSTKTSPGADVGGEKNIKKIYGENESPLSHFEIIFGRNEKSSVYSALLKSSEEYKKPISKPLGDLGLPQLMGAINDASLGQKPAEKTYENLATGLQYMVDYSRNDPERFDKIDLKQMLKSIIEPKIDKTLDLIRQQININTRETPSGGGGGDGSPTGGGGGNIESINMQGFSAEDVDALGRMIAAEAGGENSIGKAAVMAVILNRYRLIKSGTSPSQFGIRGKTKDEVTIRDVIFASGQFSPVSNGSFGRTSSSSGKAALAAAIGAGGNDPEKLKKELIKSGLNEYDADHVVRSTFFSNPETRSVVPVPGQKEIAVGRHSFQQSANVRLRGKIGAIGAEVKELPSSGTVQALSSGFRTGLKTGPAERIGSGTEYHIDARFMYDLPLKDKISMLDSMATAHAQEGFIMEFSGIGVAGERWDPNLPLKEKERLAKRVLSSHHENRHPWQAFDYFAVKRNAKNRDDKSAEGANIMAPKIAGGTYEYQQGGGYGRFLIIRDKNGREIFKVGHGDQGLPSPKEIGKIFKMDELPSQEKDRPKPSAPQLKDLKSVQNKIRDMKPGDPPLVIPGVGKVIIKKNEKGTVIKEYYDSNNKLIGSDKFFNLVKNPSQQKQSPPQQRKTPRGRSGASRQTSQASQRSEVKTYNSQTYFKSGNKYYEEIPERGVFEIPKEIYDMVPVKKKYGGLVYKPGTTPVLPEQKYASYNDPFNNGIIAIQPIYIQQPVPVPVGGGSGGMIAFSTPKVNNMDNYQQLMRE